MTEEGFRGPQVCSIVGISYRQLDYWARTGLLRPSLAEARGSGSQRLYSYRDLLQLKVIKSLLDAGLSLRSARRAVDCLREGLGEDLASTNLVLSGNRSVLTKSGEEVIDLLAGGQGVLNVLPLSGVMEEIDAAILKLEQVKEKSSELAANQAEEGEGVAFSGRLAARATSSTEKEIELSRLRAVP
ncbi:MAG: MerR family transcriptional regulator [Actinobacteria bacterium]|jgi:DNA-binding transcriptional MerR regulator|nr:MerR family transcriptional regulator [Actinomycetota bacterium]MCL6094224.1 MerR family transcriptional regulator [Actinomycetota bacterium]